MGALGLQSMAKKNYIPAKCLEDINSSEDTQHRDVPGKLSHLKCLEEIHSAIYRLYDLSPIWPFSLKYEDIHPVMLS